MNDRPDLAALLPLAAVESAAQPGEAEYAFRAVLARADSLLGAASPPDGDALVEGLLWRLLLCAGASGADELQVQLLDDGARLALRIDGLLHPMGGTSQALGSRLLECARRGAGLQGAVAAGPASLDPSSLPLGAAGGFAPDLFEGYRFAAHVYVCAGGRCWLSIRLLRTPVQDPGLEALGFDGIAVFQLARSVARRSGLIVVAGPAGAGRTSTLYALLGLIDAQARSVCTVERSVRAARPDWLQLSVDADPSLTPDRRMAGALDAALAARPDVLLVDDIAGPATARRVAQAADQGALVLCALHLSRAHQVFERFQGLGVPTTALCRGLSAVVAQRTLARLCGHCAVADDTPAARSVLARATNSWLARERVQARAASASGCTFCGGHARRGRVLLAEVLGMDNGLRALAESGLPPSALESQCHGAGRSLGDQALRLLARGEVALADLLHACTPGELGQ